MVVVGNEGNFPMSSTVKGGKPENVGCPSRETAVKEWGIPSWWTANAEHQEEVWVGPRCRQSMLIGELTDVGPPATD